MTFFPFAPTVNRNFVFSPTLDGAQYTVEVRWALFGQRWVVYVYTLQGKLVVAKPLRSSPENYDINLVAGYFKRSSLVYRASSDTFVVTP